MFWLWLLIVAPVSVGLCFLVVEVGDRCREVALEDELDRLWADDDDLAESV
jgi:hypothetical protein